LMHRNCRSRLRMRWLSSQARSRGPRVAGRGDGSRSVRWRVPPRRSGFIGMTVAVEEKDAGSVGEGGDGAEISVRWHSFRMRGIEAAGRSAGRQKA